MVASLKTTYDIGWGSIAFIGLKQCHPPNVDFGYCSSGNERYGHECRGKYGNMAKRERRRKSDDIQYGHEIMKYRQQTLSICTRTHIDAACPEQLSCQHILMLIIYSVPRNASISTTSLTASVVKTYGLSSSTATLSSILMPIPRAHFGHFSSSGT
jgi:hypothetical protein